MSLRSALMLAAAVGCGIGLAPPLGRGADWPQFRGPGRDGISSEAGLAKAWPEGGPPRLLTLEGLGEGFSSPVVAGGNVFVTGTRSGYLFLFCFAPAGRFLWRVPCGRAYTGSYPGARSTPTFADGRLYVLSGKGLLTALDAEDGRKRWMVDIFDRFGGDGPRYGAAESVLVAGERVICTPGGKDAALAALDAKTGLTLWTSRGLDDKPGHASPIPVTWGGVQQVITLTHEGMVGVRLEDGTLLWRHTKGFGWFFHENVLTPVFHNGYVFAEGGHRSGGACVRLALKDVRPGFAVEQVWKKDASSTHTGGYVVRGGCLYGASGEGWACIDMATGEVRWTEPAIRRAATIWADGRFYCVDEKGTVFLVAAGPAEATVVGKFEIPNAGSQTWAYPALSDGRLYVRRKDQVHVYDVSGRETSGGEAAPEQDEPP